MGIRVQTEAIYSGVKTGLKKSGSETGEQWIALAFRASEHYKGILIDPSQMTTPNMTIFPPDGFNRESLVIGTKYVLQLAVSGSKNSSFPQFEIISFKPL